MVMSFVVIYIGISVAFFNVKSLRSEVFSFLKKRNDTKKENAEQSRLCAEKVLRKLTDMELSLGARLEKFPDEISGIEAISKELASFSSGSDQFDNAGFNDSYKVAHRLFSLGVSMDNAQRETGLPIEEIEFIYKRVNSKTVS